MSQLDLVQNTPDGSTPLTTPLGGVADAAKVTVVGVSGTQNVNLTQVNGVAQLAGAGATGTGSERVTVAQDTTTIAGSAPGTAGTPSTNVVSVQGVVSGTSLNVTQVGATGIPWLPAGATAVTETSGNVANASAVASMPAVVGKVNYLTGFSATGGGATAASLVTITITGGWGSSGTLTYTFAVPAGATAGATPLIVEFATPIAAVSSNQAITITMPALGTGNTNAVVNIHGYVV